MESPEVRSTAFTTAIPHSVLRTDDPLSDMIYHPTSPQKWTPQPIDAPSSTDDSSQECPPSLHRTLQDLLEVHRTPPRCYERLGPSPCHPLPSPDTRRGVDKRVVVIVGWQEPPNARFLNALQRHLWEYIQSVDMQVDHCEDGRLNGERDLVWITISLSISSGFLG